VLGNGIQMKIWFLTSPWRAQSLSKYARLLSEARSGMLTGVHFTDGSIANYSDKAWLAESYKHGAGEAQDFCNEVARRNLGFVS
jgi:hypothetical protein